jgi:hypothetical protein
MKHRSKSFPPHFSSRVFPSLTQRVSESERNERKTQLSPFFLLLPSVFGVFLMGVEGMRKMIERLRVLMTTGDEQETVSGGTRDETVFVPSTVLRCCFSFSAYSSLAVPRPRDEFTELRASKSHAP